MVSQRRTSLSSGNENKNSSSVALTSSSPNVQYMFMELMEWNRSRQFNSFVSPLSISTFRISIDPENGNENESQTESFIHACWCRILQVWEILISTLCRHHWLEHHSVSLINSVESDGHLFCLVMKSVFSIFIVVTLEYLRQSMTLFKSHGNFDQRADQLPSKHASFLHLHRINNYKRKSICSFNKYINILLNGC